MMLAVPFMDTQCSQNMFLLSMEAIFVVNLQSFVPSTSGNSYACVAGRPKKCRWRNDVASGVQLMFC